MCCPHDALLSFYSNCESVFRVNRRLAAADYDLEAWRRAQEKKGGKDWVEGFAVMDLDGGAPWDFACQVLNFLLHTSCTLGPPAAVLGASCQPAQQPNTQ